MIVAAGAHVLSCRTVTGMYLASRGGEIKVRLRVKLGFQAR